MLSYTFSRYKLGKYYRQLKFPNENNIYTRSNFLLIKYSSNQNKSFLIPQLEFIRYFW